MRRGWARRTVAALAPALVVLCASRAVGARSPDPVIIVRFAPGISAPEGARLLSAMHAQLRDTARLVIGGDQALAACIVELDVSDAGTVVRFEERRRGRAIAPRLVTRTGEVGASEVATIVRAFVVAVLESGGAAAPVGTDPAASAVDPEPASAEPTGDERAVTTTAAVAAETVARSAAPVRWRVRVGAAYTATTYASSLIWQSGARVEGAVMVAPGVYVGAGYAFHPASEIVTSPVTVTLGRHSAGAFAGLESSGRTWIFGGDLGCALDGTFRTVGPSSGDMSATGGSATVAPAFALRLHGRWRVPDSRGLAFDLAPAFEIAPGARDLVAIEATGAFSRLASPSVARFRLDLGATFDGF